MKKIVNLQQYEDILKNIKKQYIFIYFYVDWCHRPCKTIIPSIKKWIKKYNQNTIYYKIDVDNKKLDQIIEFFKIGNVPIFVIFDKTDPINYLKRTADKKTIENMIKKYNR